MDVHEELVMMNKGKRTKRQRTASSSSPFVLTMGMASSCSSGYNSDHKYFTPSPSDSGELAQSSIEEEDMANCLILLARGSGGASRKMAAATATATEIYECKTCNRCFPSFQALGGHRASHKKPPKAVTGLEEKRIIKRVINYDNTSTALSLQIPGREPGVIGSGIITSNNKARVHECSICGAEFSSGQALGGHMRRHRPLPTAATGAASSSSTNEESSVKKERTLLSLDLNLDPEPEPEEYSVFTSKQETIVFTASPLVDCHY